MRAEALAEKARHAGPSSAQAMLIEALAILDPQLAANPEDRATLLASVATRLQLAALVPHSQEAALRQALAACAVQKGAQGDLRLRALQAELLLRLADARAATFATAVWRDGYRDAAFANVLREHGLPASRPVAANAAPGSRPSAR
jgi:hypothetical protein